MSHYNTAGGEETVIANSNFTPREQRTGDIGLATENRRPEQIQADNNFQAVMTPADDYDTQFGTHDPTRPPFESSGQRLRELEARAEQAKADAAYGELKTPEERELFSYRRRMAIAERDAEQKELQREWVKSVSGELTRLAELREEFTQTEGWQASDVAAVDKAAKQFRAYGSDLDAGRKMLSDIESDYEAKLAQKELELEAQIAGHRNAIERLREKRKQVPDRVYYDAEDQLYLAARKEWEAAREAGDDALAGQLRSKYFAGRIEREKATKNE